MNNEFIGIPHFFEFADARVKLTDIITYLLLRSFVEENVDYCEVPLTDICTKLRINKESLHLSLSRLSDGKMIYFKVSNKNLKVKFLTKNHNKKIPTKLIDLQLTDEEKAVLVLLNLLNEPEAKLFNSVGVIHESFRMDYTTLFNIIFGLVIKEHLMHESMDDLDGGEYYLEKLNWYPSQSVTKSGALNGEWTTAA